MGLRFPTAAKLERLASCVEIVQQQKPGETSSEVLGPFHFNAEQRKIAQVQEKSLSVVVLKGRQIGISYYFCLVDVVLAFLNPRINVVIVVDTQQKAAGLLQRCRLICEGIGIPLLKSNTRALQLSNGSQIQALTATGGADGTESGKFKSLSIQWAHITELEDWPNQSAYDDLVSALAGAPRAVECTGKQVGGRFHRLWTDARAGRNEYAPIFFPIEEHETYTSAAAITDAEWAAMQAEGFSSKPHASWWIHTLRSKGGELGGVGHVKQLHDYPAKEEHGFIAYDGRWILVDPVVKTPSIQDGISVFIPKSTATRYVAAVDTSGGVGRDANAIVVLDRATGVLAASYKSNTDDAIKLAETLQIIKRLYSPDVYVIETNGIGRSTADYAKRAGLPVRELHQDAASKQDCLDRSKRAVEARKVFGPAELLDECRSLHLNKAGAFKGRKDLLMALGMGLREVARNPHIRPRIKDENTYYPEEWGLEDSTY